jgi:hypothetical protein
MLNLGVLDTVIAVVVVIFLLSMIVQAIQTFLKKLTRFKSRQIGKSLELLFEQAIAAPAAAPAAGAVGAVAAAAGAVGAGAVGAGAPATATTTAKTLKDSVLTRFEGLGRATAFGNHALESLSKADLSKIVTQIEATNLLPANAKTSLSAFVTSMQNLQAAIQTLAGLQLSAGSQAKLTQLRATLLPIETQLSQLFAGGNLNAQAIARDVFALRKIDLGGLITIAAEVQTDLETSAATNAALVPAAQAAAAVSTALNDVHLKVVQTTAELNARVAEIESWFDTVMQGFEERYARNMRTWSFVIGLAVAVAMNATVVQLFQRMSADDVERQRVIAQGQVLEQKYAAQVAAQAQNSDDFTATFQQLKTQLASNAQSYNALGLEPITLSEWHWSLTADGLNTVLGWLIMAFLLSLGAPFWHDTLESLFGLKNYLRQQGQVQNVAQKAGEGNTQST